MMSLINGMFDVVKFIDAAVHSPLPMFARNASFASNFQSAIMLGAPLSLIFGAVFAYRLFSKHDAPAPEHDGEWGEGRRSENASLGSGVFRQSQNRNFKTFEGS